MWFFYSCGQSKRKAFLRWLLQIGRNDIVKKIHAASIRMKLYTANAHMEMEREMQREVYMEDKYEHMSSDFALSYEWGLYISFAANDYVRNMLNKYSDYEITRAEEAGKEALKTFVEERAQPTIVAKRFRETMSEVGKTFSSVDSSDPLFREKKYFEREANPYGYPFNEDKFEHQTANLQKFTSNTPHDVRFGSAMHNLLGLEKESLHRGGSLYPGDEDYDLNKDVHDFLDDSILFQAEEKLIEGVSGGGGEKTIRKKMMQETDFEDDEIYQRFLENSEAGHFHEHFDQILLRLSRNTVAKKGGRVESYNCIMLVGTRGFCGIGFGKAPSPSTAEEKAKMNALKNMSSLKVDPKGVISQKLEGRYKKTKVFITPNKNPGARGHPVLATIANYLGLQYVTIKTYGSRNLLSVIPAFFNCLEKLTTVEDQSMRLGQMPVHMLHQTSDFREQCRNRHVFGFQWNK